MAFAVHFENMDMMGQAVDGAPVNRSDPNTLVHSSNGRLLQNRMVLSRRFREAMASPARAQ